MYLVSRVNCNKIQTNHINAIFNVNCVGVISFSCFKIIFVNCLRVHKIQLWQNLINNKGSSIKFNPHFLNFFCKKIIQYFNITKCHELYSIPRRWRMWHWRSVSKCMCIQTRGRGYRGRWRLWSLNSRWWASTASGILIW